MKSSSCALPALSVELEKALPRGTRWTQRIIGGNTSQSCGRVAHLPSVAIPLIVVNLELAAAIKLDMARMGKVIKEAGIRAE